MLFIKLHIFLIFLFLFFVLISYYKYEKRDYGCVTALVLWCLETNFSTK